jgi:hypothetical protein
MTAMNTNTGINDKHGTPIHVGDILDCDYGYQVQVQHDQTGFSGKLVMSDKSNRDNQSCANIPYSLGDGSTYAHPRV